MKGAAARLRGGFTLVEVLVTLMFVGVVVPVALKGISLATRAASDTERRRQAVELADNLLSELSASDLSRFTAQSGDFSPDYPEYRWAASVIDRGEGTVKELSVEVKWPFRGETPSVTLTTLVYEGENEQGEE